MKKFLLLLIIALLVSSIESFAQLKKADAYYNSLRFVKAIPLFKKVLEKTGGPVIAAKLGDCYYQLNDYRNAEIYFSQAVKSDNISSDVYLKYGKVLKTNRSLSEAKKVFVVYASKNPSDKMANHYALDIDQIQSWDAAEPEFKIEHLDGLNTSGAEFSAIPYDNGLVFVSDRGPDFINGLENPMNNMPFLEVYYASLKDGEFKKPKTLSRVFVSSFHNGPVSFNKDRSTAVFTRVISVRNKDRENIIRPQLFVSEKSNKRWKKAVPFQYNNPNYSLAHPALSPDGKNLYFSSDMPGGQGGKDIYVCHKNGDEWSKPENLGSTINTESDESFPFITEDGSLYFSSDGWTGYGGLDIFKSEYKNGNWTDAVNLKSPLNSGADDFGFIFKDEKTGYFSSNRSGGAGDDDIYQFEMLKKAPKKTSISGIFMFSKLRSGANSTINLLDENNNVLQTVSTNNNGEFKFSDLDPDKNYMLSIDEKDSRLTEQSSMFITNENGDKILELKKSNNSSFSFTALTPEQYAALPLLPEEDQSLLTISLFGQLYDKLPGDYSAGIEVQIVDDGGKILYSSLTDDDGNFKFEKLPPDQNYYFKVNDANENTNMLILNEKGELIESVKVGDKGIYDYERLDPDETIITLLDEKDAVIKIRPEDNFIISNIYYDYDSWEINEDAAHELDKLVAILKKNKHIGVDLSSHTDSRASDDYNMELSENRAKAAVDYIVKAGISSKRIQGKGYGETRLVNRCSNGVDCTEEEHAKNRRTEFKIVKMD